MIAADIVDESYYEYKKHIRVCPQQQYQQH